MSGIVCSSCVSLPGENCSNAQDLSTLTSPYSGTTVGYTDDIPICRTGYADRLFYIDVPNGSSIDIWESTNGYDEYEYMGYGSSCTGTTTINCWDNDALAHNTWTNTTGSEQRVWYVQDAYNGSGTFTLNWILTASDPCSEAIVISSVPVTNQAVVCTVAALPGNLNETNVPTACGGASNYYKGGQESLYTFTPTVSGNYTISYSGQTWSAIFVYSGACPASGGTCIGSVGSYSSSQSIVVTLTAGVLYYIWFDTWPTPNSPCPGTFSIAIYTPTVCDYAVPYSGSNSITASSGFICDENGWELNYNNNVDGYAVINPVSIGDKVKITFTHFETESDYDYVFIYDGSNTSAPLLGQYSGSILPPSFTSTNGSLTIHFTSDGSVAYRGFRIEISYENTLPVELISFEYDCEISSLNWTTASEINNDYFIVEKSYNGINWENIAKINGNGNSNIENNYNYVIKDNNVYYHLIQVDYDGTKTYHDIIYVACESDIFDVYPIPANRSNFINICCDDIESLEVIDMVGQNIQFIREGNSIKIDIPGTYILIINTAQVEKLIIK
jgi:hypothetical protein